MRRMLQSSRGFTLPEVLVVTGALILLLGLSVRFTHPHDYSPERRNAQRQLDIVRLARALGQFRAANGGWPAAITTKVQEIGSADGEVNLCALVPTYLKVMPYDPTHGLSAPETCAKDREYLTGYNVSMSADAQHITLSAPNAETKARITLTL